MKLFLTWLILPRLLLLLLVSSLNFNYVEATDPTRENVDYLHRMNVHGRPLTISGFSSGGSMASQMQVAFSKSFDGAAVFSATWYRCGAYGRLFYRTICSSGLYPFSKGVADAQRYELEGLIDPLENLRGQKFYHWIGVRDELAGPASRSQSADFYKTVGMDPDNIRLEFSQLGHHFMPTANQNNPSCTRKLAFLLALDPRLVGVSYCDYDGAFEGLNFLFGGTLIRPNRIGVGTGGGTGSGALLTVTELEPLRKFNQTIFLNQSIRGGQPVLDPIGFYYVPSKCKLHPEDDGRGSATFKRCHFHVSLHGCLGSRSRVGDRFVRQSGYLEVAEVNDIIMLFPQSSSQFSRNSKGCWDYNGVTGDNYATRQGVQMMALAKMIETVTGQKLI